MKTEATMTHDEFHNLKSAYLAGGLADAERAAVEQHAATCPACAAALEQADAADRELDDLFAAARPGDGLEDRVIAHLRAAPPAPLPLHPLVRRAAVGVAAAIVLGAVGFAVTSASRTDQYGAGQSLATVTRENRAGTEVTPASPSTLARELGEELLGGLDASGGGSSSLGRGQQVRSEAQERHDSARGEPMAKPARQPAQQGQQQGTSGYGVVPFYAAAGEGVAGRQPDSNAQPKDNRTQLRLGIPVERAGGARNGGTAVGGRPDAGGKPAIIELRAGDITSEEASPLDNLAPSGAPDKDARPADQFDSYALPSEDGHVDGAAPPPNLPRGRGVQMNEEDFDKDNRAGEARIPYDDILKYPTNWPEVSEPRDASAGQAPPKTDKPQAVEGEVILGRRLTLLKDNTAPPPAEDAAGKPTAGVAIAGQPGAPAQAGDVVRGTVNAVAQAQQQHQAERKVIRNGEMTFEVDGYDSSVLQITKIAAEEGGFVATTESEKLPNGKVKGSVVVRCPPERLDTLVLKLRGLGDLKNSRISAQDVTKQYTDLDAQLRAARTMETRLLELIKGGKGEVKDLIEAEKQLGSWREKIEKLEGEIRYYNNLVALSTLTVTLAERDVRAAALLSETEQVNMGVEAADVEKARAEAIKAIEEAKGRIVESDLKTHDAGQFAATIAADVSPDRAGAVIDRLKQLGRVARLEVQRRQSTAEGTGAPAPGARVERKDTRLFLSIYNLANVAARSRTDLHLAADDVEKVYRTVLAQVESAGGRVLNSQLTKPMPQQTTGTIAFEVPSGGADVLLDAVRGAGEVVRLETSTNKDTQNVTDAKRAFSVQVRSETTIPARESVTLQLAVDDVASKYDKLLDALRNAGARVVQSEIDQQNPNRTTATLQVDARRDQRGAVDKALADAGGVYGRAVSRPAEGEAALEDKVRLNVTMHDVDHLAPRETTTLGVEAHDVTKAAADVESTAVLLGGRKVDSDWAQQPGGQSVARVVVDVPVARAPELIDKASGQGRVLTVQREQNPSSREGAFARARLSVTFATADPIVQTDQSLFGSIRSGLATSVQWLLRSVTLVVIGLCLVGPWALVLWLAWKVVQRRRRRRAAREGDGTIPPTAPGAAVPVTSA